MCRQMLSVLHATLPEVPTEVVLMLGLGVSTSPIGFFSQGVCLPEICSNSDRGELGSQRVILSQRGTQPSIV